MRGSVLGCLAASALVLSLAGAEELFDSALTSANWDAADSAEFPKHPDPKGGFPVAASREDGLARALHIRLPLTPHGGWWTAETEQKTRHLRLAFKTPLAVGTLIGAAGRISYLKPDASAPGDVTVDEQWIEVPAVEGQAGLDVTPFPPGITTRALRLTFHESPPPGGKSRSGVGGLLILKARLHNLTPEATAFASSQVTGGASVVEANRVQNLVTGGTWTAAPAQDISPEHPEWVILAWPQARAFRGVGFANAFAKTLEVDVLKPEEQSHPAAAPEASWAKAGALAWPIWWRPAYTDAYLPFKEPLTARAIRVRITQPLTTENDDIKYHSGGSRRKASLSGVMCFTDLGAQPVPPRPKAAVEPPPLKIAYTMPCAGKVALALDDAEGRRVRNLVAEADRAAGPQSEAWDGRDDAGRIVPPGAYTWKAVTHAPLHLSYQATVNCSGNPPWWKSGSWGDQAGPGSWLSDHCPPNDVTTIGERVFVGAVLAESGHTILACDLDGNKVWGTKWLETAGAGFLTNDGRKVYSLGEGGWIGERLYIHEIDPQTFKWRRVTQLVFDTGNSPGAGASGLAARDGKLYVAFNQPPRPWVRSALATQNLDEKNTSPAKFAFGGEFLGLLRTKGDPPPHGSWNTPASPEPVQHLRLAFKKPQPVGSVVSPAEMHVSALKEDAPFPGDLSKDELWTPFPAPAPGALRVWTAPPKLQTRALRFTFQAPKKDGKPWEAHLPGALVLSRRFADIAGGGAVSVSSGEAKGAAWTAVRQTPITPDDPAVLTLAWPEARTFRGLGFAGWFAKRVEVDAFTGPADADPAKAPREAWTCLGSLQPAVRWRPYYSDDYFDAGKNVTTRAVRLRVVEAWTAENGDIQSLCGGKPTRAGLGGVVVFQHLGDDPADAEVPSQRISVVHIANGQWEREIPVPAPRFPHFDAQGNLAVVSGKQIVRVNLADGALQPLITTGLEDPRGLAFDAQGNLYVADGGPQVVKVFSPDGKPLRTLASAGGRQIGAYDVNRLANPQGIAVDARGRVWVAEADHQPKRTSVWTADGKFVAEFIGPAAYGGGGFLDPQDKSRFYYFGMEFALDWQTRAWRVKNILSRTQPAFGGMHTCHPVYLNGKQYMVNDPGANGDTSGALLLVGEFSGDRVVPRTVIGNADQWRPFAEIPELRELVKGKPLTQHSFLWADQNGDGLPQASEVTLSSQGLRLNSSYWPSRVGKSLQVFLGNRLLKPASFTPCGAPVYQPFEAKPIEKIPSENVYAHAMDGQGRVLVNGRPVLALASDGRVAWSYPQQWVGVHDSQQAASPKPGQLVGGLGFIGQEEVPGLGETFMLSGNKGEWYLFTTDGLLAATLWHDYRLPGVVTWNFPTAERGMPLDHVTVGEEHFGGGFVRTADGKFYLVAGHNHNSIAELTGLDTMKRQEGKLELTAKDIAAVEQWVKRQALAQAEKEPPKVIRVRAPGAPVKLDGKLDEWKEDAFRPLGDRGAFALAWDEVNLYVAFRVSSGQPLRNGGDDPNLLFKTGDSVNLELGTDPKADPKRTAPVPGDQRLLLTLFGGKPVGVLYKHRVPGTPEAEKTAFASPWRAEHVDKIVRLEPSQVAVAAMPQGYAVEAAVPLALLGVKPQKGVAYKLDAGVLTGDASGGATQVRTYWSNKATGVVSDVPSEIMLTPGLWGEATFE